MKQNLALVLIAAAVFGWLARAELKSEGGCSPVYPGSVQEAASSNYQCYRSSDSYNTVVTYYRRQLGPAWTELPKPLVDRIFLESGISFGKNLALEDGKYEVLQADQPGWLLTVSSSRMDGMRSFISLTRYTR